MADNQDSVGIASLPSYGQLKLPEQLMVRLRVAGKEYAEIATTVFQEYGVTRNSDYIRQMFGPGGRLEQAFLDVSGFFGKSSLAKMNILLERSTETAAKVLIGGMSVEHDMNTRIRAAHIIVSRYPRKTEIDVTISAGAPPPILAAVLAEHDELVAAGRQALDTGLKTEETPNESV